MSSIAHVGFWEGTLGCGHGLNMVIHIWGTTGDGSWKKVGVCGLLFGETGKRGGEVIMGF